MMKCPRRFIAKHGSVISVQSGSSSPLLIASIRSRGDAQADQVVLHRAARRSPSARLYSLVPRASACPSTVTLIDVQRRM